MKIEKVGVVGCGIMGAGIAQLALEAGYKVTVREMDEALLTKGISRVHKGIDKLRDKELLSLPIGTGCLNLRVRQRCDLGDCDLVNEAVF